MLVPAGGAHALMIFPVITPIKTVGKVSIGVGSLSTFRVGMLLGMRLSSVATARHTSLMLTRQFCLWRERDSQGLDGYFCGTSGRVVGPYSLPNFQFPI